MTETPSASPFEWQAPPEWPAISLPAVREQLCAAGQPFEMEMADVEGVPTRVWKNAHPSLAAMAEHAKGHGSDEFLIFQDERVSYESWYKAVATLAHTLLELGVVKGDRVALAMRNLPEWPVAFFAGVSIGAIVVPLNAWWTDQELQFGLENSGSKILICDNERWARIEPQLGNLPALEGALVSRAEGELRAPAKQLENIIGYPNEYADLPDIALPEASIAPDDPAAIFYTSGTTGKPKGALGSHRNFTSNAVSSAYAAASSFVRRGEPLPKPRKRVGLTVVPMFHCTACSAVMMQTVHAGNKMIYMHKWDTEHAMQIIERERVNSTGGVPFIAWQLIEHQKREQYDLSSLETISYGGAPSAPELARKVYETFGAFPSNGWGMTETMGTVSLHMAEDYLNRPKSCGPPVAAADLKIMKDDGSEELAVGEVGELWARGPMIVKGYWKRPDATSETFVDGWVRTGDLARLDDEGFCFIVDRAKDMIIRGGENIFSSEVENILYDHPAVLDAALVGIPHKTLGEEPAAIVFLRTGVTASEAELQDWVRGRMAHFNVPVRVLFSQDSLPRNPNGKILKRELVSLFE